jgi:hypothetical protein
VGPREHGKSKKKLKVPLTESKAQWGGRGIALLFIDLGARMGRWSSPRLGRFTPGEDPITIIREAGWAPEPIWTDEENLALSGFDPRTIQPVVSRYTD